MLCDSSVAIVSPTNRKMMHRVLPDLSVEIVSPTDRKPKCRRSISKEIPTCHPPPHACKSQLFPSLHAAIGAVYDEEEALGHKWVKGQMKKNSGGELQHITLRCNHYHLPEAQHSIDIDPANHRQGKSNKTDCKAHVNIIRDPETEQWKLSIAVWVHNHEPEIPQGGNAIRPPTKKLWAATSAIASTTNLGHSNISKLLKQHPDYNTKHPLEP
jgi:hypothetical protein